MKLVRHRAPEPSATEDTSSPLLSLPPELFCLILSYLSALSPESTAALYLTTRRLYDNPGKAYVKSMDKLPNNRLLALLERNFPGHYLCHSCATYHPIVAADTPRNYATASINHPQSKCNIKTGLCLYHLHGISFRHVQQAVSRTRLGARYGIALDGFARADVFQAGPRLQVRQQLSARVVGGELLVAGFFRFRGAEYPGITGKIEKQGWSVCPHVTIGPDTGIVVGNVCLETRLLECLPQAAKCGELGLRVGESYCKFCCTDFSFGLRAVDPLDFEKGMDLNVRFHRNLGDGSSPDEWKWRAAANTYKGFSQQMREVRTAQDSGTILRAWNTDVEAEEKAAKQKWGRNVRCNTEDARGRGGEGCHGGRKTPFGKVREAGDLYRRTRKRLQSALRRDESMKTR